MKAHHLRISDIMTYSLVFVVSLTTLMWISNIHAARHQQALATDGDGESSASYLYNTPDSPPVLDHGISGHDFLTSISPKVVEFYDPKCGACQAFKSNYIEVAKKVRAQKPNVEFYGVSCELYMDICDKYGDKRVPKIFAFSSDSSDASKGRQVEKGSGTIYFLSARLMKALRTPEEVALDGTKMASSIVEASSKKRRLREYSDDDEVMIEDEDEDEDEEEELSVDLSSDGNYEGGIWDFEPEEDNNEEFSELDYEDAPTDLQRLISWGNTFINPNNDDEEEDGSADDEVLRKDYDNASEDGEENDDEVLRKDYDGQVQIASKDESKAEEGTSDEEDKQDGSDSAESTKSEESQDDNAQLNKEPKDDHHAYKKTDAYKNTMKHFETLDVQKGKEKGYHWDKWQDEKKRAGSRFDGNNNDRPTKKGADPPREKARSPAKIADYATEKKVTSGPVISSRTGGSIIHKGNPRTDPIPLTKVTGNTKVWGAGEHAARNSLPVGGDVNAPNPLDTDPIRAKKFQEYVARKKKMLERKEKMKHPINTLLGTRKKEEDDINTKQNQALLQKKNSPMNNYKSQYINTPNIKNGKMPDLRPEAQKKTVGEKVLKKIPLVKRAFKRSKGEETLNDAALSFTRGLLMGVFKTNEPLNYKKKAALLDWFDLVRVCLPPEIGLHELIDTLKGSIDEVAQRRENLLQVISKFTQHFPETKWSQSCTKGTTSGGFFCGFWKLLHVMSLGFSEQAGGLALRESSPSIRVFSAKEAGDVLREYMALFFNCEKCSKRFISQYDDCSFSRCHRLIDESVDAPAESWREFPLWLWQVHNDVSRSKSMRASDFHEKEGNRAEAKRWEKDLSAIYPHLDECISCVNSEGTWNLHEVYRHLENEYWSFGHTLVHPKMEQLLGYNDRGSSSSSSSGIWKLFLVTFLLLLFLGAKKLRMKITGRHKKLDISSFRSSKKYRDS